jgi:hypothetical protein
MHEDPKTEEMRVLQGAREREERKRAEESEKEPETASHDRRATKAAYLRAKLEERARSERGER